MKKQNILISLNFLLIFICLGFGLWIRSKLPPMLAIHFNLSGEPDQYSNRDAVIVIMPMLALFSSILIDFFLRSDEAFYKKLENRIASAQINLGITVLLMCIYLGQIFIGLNHEIRNFSFLSFGFGLFLLVVSFPLKKLDPNFIVGIRLPWTMAQVDNWKKTHLLASQLMLPMSFVLIGLSFFNQFNTLAITLFVACFLIPSLYSYALGKRQL